MNDQFYTFQDDSGDKFKVYNGHNNPNVDLKELFAAKTRAYFPADVNIRIITDESADIIGHTEEWRLFVHDPSLTPGLA